MNVDEMLTNLSNLPFLKETVKFVYIVAEACTFSHAPQIEKSTQFSRNCLQTRPERNIMRTILHVPPSVMSTALVALAVRRMGLVQC